MTVNTTCFGVIWNVLSNQIVFMLAEQAQNLEPTKRTVISLIRRFYDRLGFLAPFVVEYKICMQALCELGPDNTGITDESMVEVGDSLGRGSTYIDSSMLPREGEAKLWSVGTVMPHYLPMWQLSTCGMTVS